MIDQPINRLRPVCYYTGLVVLVLNALQLLPILTSTGRGSDIMVPMSIPTFGGMLIQTMTIFIVPVLQCMWREWAIRKQGHKNE